MRTKELLVTYEQSLNRKDHIIVNLTRALQGQKNKCSLQHAFGLWKLKMCDEKREVRISVNVNIVNTLFSPFTILFTVAKEAGGGGAI